MLQSKMPPAIISDMNEHIDEDISAEEMMKLLRECRKNLEGSHQAPGHDQNPVPTTPSRQQRPKNEGRPGLSNIANMVHFKPPKENDVSKLS